jgi:copper chaperone CopZ
MSGHAIFNWKSPVMEKIDPCCQHGEIDEEEEEEENKRALAGLAGVKVVSRTNAGKGMYEPLMPSTSVTERTVLAVQGMMCDNNCGSTVRKALAQVAGVVQSDVDVPNAKVVVHHAEGVKASDLVNAVEAVGFDAQAS